MKRILSGLLAAVMLLGAAAGCSETKTEEETEKNAAVMPETPVPEEAPETDPPEYEAPGKDYDGATFTTAWPGGARKPSSPFSRNSRILKSGIAPYATVRGPS